MFILVPLEIADCGRQFATQQHTSWTSKNGGWPASKPRSDDEMSAGCRAFRSEGEERIRIRSTKEWILMALGTLTSPSTSFLTQPSMKLKTVCDRVMEVVLFAGRKTTKDIMTSKSVRESINVRAPFFIPQVQPSHKFNHPINHTINHTINHPINHHINQYIDQPCVRRIEDPGCIIRKVQRR
jgi:hypothetical protein